MRIVCRALLEGADGHRDERWLYYLIEEGFILLIWSERGRVL